MNEELTVGMVAKMTGKTRQTVYNWIKAKKVKTYGVHGATRIDRDSLDSFLNSLPAVRGGVSDISGASSLEGAAGF